METRTKNAANEYDRDRTHNANNNNTDVLVTESVTDHMGEQGEDEDSLISK